MAAHQKYIYRMTEAPFSEDEGPPSEGKLCPDSEPCTRQYKLSCRLPPVRIIATLPC